MLSVLGIWSLKTHERGLRAERLGQFVAVAEQIRLDVKNRLDEFLQVEQRRPYTDYQNVYVPETAGGDGALVRSPLADSMTHGLAYGHFQIDAQGTITTPYALLSEAPSKMEPELAAYLTLLRSGVLESLRGRYALSSHRIDSPVTRQPTEWDKFEEADAAYRRQIPPVEVQRQAAAEAPRQGGSRLPSQAGRYPIESLQEAQQTQTVRQTRDIVSRNVAISAADSPLRQRQSAGDTAVSSGTARVQPDTPPAMRGMARPEESAQKPFQIEPDTAAEAGSKADIEQAEQMVQIRIEPFVPLIVPDDNDSDSIFPDVVFLVRHVQIEDTHLLQGFCLDEDELVRQVHQSAGRLLREGMGFELARTPRADAAHTAILDFGFGQLALNLLEMEPGWIAARVARLNTWLVGILAVVWLAVLLAMMGLWRNLREQVSLARKKDDFISAVSHELRTPLTSIRMYTEMLEKDWVKEESRKREYYGTMRQESERLSRLIENVLDFSRLQRGKKQFDFTMGDVNGCIRDVVEMMRPCAERNGFAIETELREMAPFAFDRDAVMQIVINLIDNALKYAKDAADKRIVVRSRPEKRSVIIEVEDHGPGIPKSQQKRIFEAFYRCGDEATRQANGTGLGLALVKRFAQAHRGLVEVLNVKPNGVIFRIHLAR